MGMSINHKPPPRQIRDVGRAPVTHHNNEASVGHEFGALARPTVLDKDNGTDFAGGSGNAPGSAGQGEPVEIDQGDFKPSSW
jgi:hypothetical protein